MSDLKSNNNLADQGWALMEEQLNKAMPVKKPKRRYLFFLLPFVGILALASYWLIPDWKANQDDLKIDSNNIEVSKQFAENSKDEIELFEANSLVNEVIENDNVETKETLAPNSVKNKNNDNLKSKQIIKGIEQLEERKFEQKDFITTSTPIFQEEETVSVVSSMPITNVKTCEHNHVDIQIVSPLTSLDFTSILLENQDVSINPTQIPPYKPKRNTIGLKGGMQMGSEIPFSGAELGITYSHKIGRRWSINTGASFDYINHKNETARAVQLGSGNIKEYEVNSGWLSTSNDEAFELPDQFFTIPLTVNYKVFDKLSVYAGPSFSFGVPTSLREKIGLKGASADPDIGNNGIPIEDLFNEKNSQTQDFGDFTFKKNLLLLNAGIQYNFNNNWSVDLGFTTTIEKGRSYNGLKLTDPDFSADLVTQAEVSPYLEKLLPKWYGSISISRRIISF